MMRWEKLDTHNGGPGKRWGHTCNAVRGGQLLYIFGGYSQHNTQTNKVHVYDTTARTWSEPDMQGTLPVPRDSHSCTTVGDKLFVFGGTDGNISLKDLHVLDTSTNTWMTPCVRGEGPEAREGHSAAVVGKRLFIFGGCGKSSDTPVEEYFDDLYILNTETMVWKRVATTGIPPAKRNSHTCVSWKNKIIVIGGEDTQNYYMSDVQMLDTDTLTWTKLITNGELLPPRAGHTTVALGKNLLVFGGFTDAEDLYDDLYMFDLETFRWTKVITLGVGPSARFSMAGSTLHPQHGGVLIFMGGCNKSLEALDDMFYLHTGLVIENERDERKPEKLSLRKQLRLKSQEQQTLNPACESPVFGMETSFNDSKRPMTVPTHTQVPDRMNIYLNNNHNANGKRTFHAKVTKSITNCYTIETVIDGKPLRGVLFSNNFGSKKSADDLRRKRVAVDSGKKDFEQLMADTTRSSEQQTPGATSAASDMKTPAASNVSPLHEVSVDKKSSMEFNKMNTSAAAAEDTANSFHNHEGQYQPLTTEEHGLQGTPLTQQV
ncbi:putative galactose oxidase/kelch, beta-propeller, kelch-type beta propeller [Helianthus annuus]|uniref:Galactose oxidase/kelch, beta-propeller, kelch-type beta propeller n=1 Tax=Helianthus annuus TaxID=4232 RepID=A0A251U0L1_HELAN|nr:rho GTPase-activating protein gacHH isoform X2 [Helianthus annuus]KAF5792633.1 putative galactose oxidase/kelch, beta-propeller, kelch-type beta propeller [Helianthus annuus]